MRLALKVAIVCSHDAAPATALTRLFASHHARNNDSRFIEWTAIKHEVRMKQNFITGTLDPTLIESKRF
jgi:hypothetical protein